MKSVLLVNMPFADVLTPSLALGIFKAEFQDQGIPCDSANLNILFAEMVGWDNYEVIGQMTALAAGEQMFAQELFGFYIPSDRQYNYEVVAKIAMDVLPRLEHMRTYVKPFLKTCFEQIPWDAYEIIGFTSLFEQNIPSLTLAYHIKTRFPNKTIVFGGANCEDIMGITMHKYFPFVDYVFTGEADETFPEFVKRLSKGQTIQDLPGIVYRQNGKSIHTGDAIKVTDLDSLPFPNYDEFYLHLLSSSLPRWLNKYVVLETSRGCWWGEKTKCTFCGLNGRNIEFRSKSAERIIDEILYLKNCYQPYNVKDFRIIDNVLSPEFYENVIPMIKDLDLGSGFYIEVRPSLQKEELKTLADAGFTMIQPGIENLCTRILKLMRKGTTSLQNIQLLKWCIQYGVRADWNILFGFPGETPADYARCLELGEVVSHLNAPTTCGPIRMDRFSPNFDQADKLGFKNIKPHHIYRYLYPFSEDILKDLVYYFDYEYQEKRDSQEWYRSMIQQVNNWKQSQDRMYAQSFHDQLVIDDTRPVASSNQIILEGVRKNIYEYCDRKRSLNQISNWLNSTFKNSIPDKDIMTILDEFIECKLMVREGSFFLSLAVLFDNV